MSFGTPKLSIRQAMQEMLANVDRSPLNLPPKVEYGSQSIDSMQAGIKFVWEAAKSNDPSCVDPCRVLNHHGKVELRPNALARQVLLHLPGWSALLRVFSNPAMPTQTHPALQILMEVLSELNYPKPSSVEELEVTCRSEPAMYAMLLNYIVKTVRNRARKAIFRSDIHNFDYCCNEDYKLYSTYFKQVLKANPGSVFLQFELSMMDGYKTEPTIDDTLRSLWDARKVLVERIKKQYGKAISGFAWRLQETLWAPVIHCVALVDGPSQEERQILLQTLSEEWWQIAGPRAHFFDTCAKGLIFRYRGMAPDVAETYSKLDRVTHCATYLSKTQQLLRLEWNINLPFAGIGPLDAEQNLRILTGKIAEIKLPRHVLAEGLVMPSAPRLIFRPEGQAQPRFGAEYGGRD